MSGEKNQSSFARKTLLWMLVSALCVVSQRSAAAELDDDWIALQNLLPTYNAVLTTPPSASSIVTHNYTAGQLLGNGDIGVSIGDTTTRQTFRFGKLDFWASNVKRPTDTGNNGYVWQQGCITVGGLTISSPNPGSSPGPVYQMTQDILNAENRATMQFQDGFGNNVTLNMTSWTSDATNLFVVELTSPPGSNPVTLNANLFVNAQYQYRNQWLDCINIYPYATGITNGILWAARHNYVTNTDDDTYDFGAGVKEAIPQYDASVSMATKLIGANFNGATTGTNSGTPGTCFANGSFTLPGGATVYLVTAIQSVVVCSNSFLSIGPDGNSVVLMSTNIATLEAARTRALDTLSGLDATAIANLKSNHRQWWKDFYLKSYVRLNDPWLEKFYFNSLYVMGCNFRGNKIVPPGLWGVWSMTDVPNWGGRYTQNYNFEAPTYGMFSCNRPELARPYIATMVNELPVNRDRTHDAGWDGTEFRRSCTPYNLLTVHGAPHPIAGTKNNSLLPAWDQKSNGSFSAMPMIWYYEYTQDTNYLADYLYPHLKELDAFWESYMDKSSVPYMIYKSSAHEGDTDTNPNQDLGFIRKICKTLIGASQLLQRDTNMIPVWQDVLAKLADYPTVMTNSKTVYAENLSYNGGGPHWHPGDQPINMEGCVFPGEQVYLGGDSSKIQIALDTLSEQNCWSVSSSGSGSKNNGFPKVYPIAARVGWPADDLFKNFTNSIAYHWRSGNATASEGGGGIEMIGAIEGIDSMLMQSEGGAIRVFPVWPTSRNAYFKRLRAKGAFVVSSEFTNGVVTHVDLTSEAGQSVGLVNPWAGGLSVQQIDNDGNVIGPVSFTLSNGKINFDTIAGGRYWLTGAAGGFSISATPGSRTVGTSGGNVSYTVNVTTNFGFSGSVNLSVSGLPSGATGSFTPPGLSGSGSATLNIALPNPTSAGDYFINLTAAGDVTTNSTTVVLVVNPPFSGATTNIYQAELSQITLTSGDTVQTNTEAGFSNGQAVQYNSTSIGDYITFRLPDIAAGTYDVRIGVKKYTSRGIVQLLAGDADGTLTNVGAPFDLYGGTSFTELALGNWTTLASGDKDFEFLVTGKNASSSGYTIVVDYVKLTSVPGADSDGDGIPDWWMNQNFGHATGDAGDNSLASNDADGDGMSNYAEYLAGTDPLNSASVFHLLSIAPSTNSLTVTWTTVGGHSYVVQGATNMANGFSDISPLISMPGSAESVTNFTDPMTNQTRFYRVRLGP